MNKVGTLESQLMDAFKEKEEKEVATTAADAQKLQEKEIEAHAARTFCPTWKLHSGMMNMKSFFVAESVIGA